MQVPIWIWMHFMFDCQLYFFCNKNGDFSSVDRCCFRKSIGQVGKSAIKLRKEEAHLLTSTVPDRINKSRADQWRKQEHHCALWSRLNKTEKSTRVRDYFCTIFQGSGKSPFSIDYFRRHAPRTTHATVCRGIRVSETPAHTRHKTSILHTTPSCK